MAAAGLQVPRSSRSRPNLIFLFKNQSESLIKYSVARFSSEAPRVSMNNTLMSSVQITIFGGPETLKISFVYATNNIGPRVDPSRKPCLIVKQLNWNIFSYVSWYRWFKDFSRDHVYCNSSTRSEQYYAEPYKMHFKVKNRASCVSFVFICK